MTACHELLQDTLAQDRDVTRPIEAHSPYVFRVKRFSEMHETSIFIGDHTLKTVEVGDLAKVDLLRCSHALGKCGLFENVEMTMKKAPKIGQRVSYRSDYLIEYEKEPRVCTGTVVRIYPHRDDVFDDDGEFVRIGPMMPEEQWSAAVQVDKPLPQWWAYGECDRFAPEVAELEPL